MNIRQFGKQLFPLAIATLLSLGGCGGAGDLAECAWWGGESHGECKTDSDCTHANEVCRIPGMNCRKVCIPREIPDAK